MQSVRCVECSTRWLGQAAQLNLSICDCDCSERAHWCARSMNELSFCCYISRCCLNKYQSVVILGAYFFSYAKGMMIMGHKTYANLQQRVKYIKCGGRCAHCGRQACDMTRGHDKSISCWCGCYVDLKKKPKRTK